MSDQHIDNGGTPTPQPDAEDTIQGGGGDDSLEGGNATIEGGNATVSGGANGDPPRWAQERIDAITGNWRAEQRARAAEKAESTARLADLQAQLAALQNGGSGTSGAPPPARQQAPSPQLTPEQLQGLVDEAANAKVAQQEFSRACDDAVAAGRKEYQPADFDSAMRNLANVGITPTLVQAALDTGAGHKVLFALGRDTDGMNEAARILKMPPMRMASALTKMALEIDAGTRQVSGAPPPIKPIRGRASGDTTSLSDDLPMAEWIKRRNKILATQD